MTKMYEIPIGIVINYATNQIGFCGSAIYL